MFPVSRWVANHVGKSDFEHFFSVFYQLYHITTIFSSTDAFAEKNHKLFQMWYILDYNNFFLF
jgi:hypothetical protein